MANARSEDFKSDLCRLSFAGGLFKARAVEAGTTPKFSATLIFPKSARAGLEKIVAKVLTDEWGPEGLKRAAAGKIRSPFLAGDGKEAKDDSGALKPGMGPDLFFIRVQANEDRPPVVWWRDPNRQETEATVYSGCYGKAILNCFAWKHKTGGDGVSFGIQGFQKHAEGERLGGSGAINPERWSEKIEDEGPAPDSTTSGAGASGLFGA
jgi:hypothetical protein